MIIGVSGKINSGKDTVGSIIQYLYYEHSYIDIDKKLSYEEFVKTDRTNNILVSSVIPEIKKFADKLKDIVCILLSCTREQLEDREFKENLLGEEWWYYIHPINGDMIPYIHSDSLENETSTLIKLTPRLLLQLIGTECGRQIIHPNIWVNATMADYKFNCKPIYLEPQRFEPDLISIEESNWIITDVRFPNEAKAINDKGGINIRVDRGWVNLETINDNYKRIGSSLYNPNFKVHESETALDNYSFDYIVNNNSTIEELILRIKEILLIEKII